MILVWSLSCTSTFWRAWEASFDTCGGATESAVASAAICDGSVE